MTLFIASTAQSENIFQKLVLKTKTTQSKLMSKKNEVELSLSLNVYKKCEDELCLIFSPIFGSQKIQLEAENGNCDSLSESCEVYHYRGFWSDVDLLDGVRYIGIVKVDKYIQSFDENGNVLAATYSITIEILGNDGVEALVELHDIKDINNFNSITLKTIPKKSLFGSYYASLIVGDKNSGNTSPIPCEETDCDFSTKPLARKQTTPYNYNVIKGLVETL